MDGVPANPPPYALPSNAGVYTGMIEDVAFELILTLGEPGVVTGDGTMPYPGNSRVLEVPDVPKTVKETKLGKTRPLLEEPAVPGTSGWLETAVCSGISGMVVVNGEAERLPVPCTPAAEEVEINGRVNEGCDKDMMVKDGKEEAAVSPGELEDGAGLLGGATHFVQSVDVEVRVTVEIVVVVSSNDVLPEVTRLVTGQVVKVV